MIDPQPLGLLERAGLRKAALDAGFDVLTDRPNCCPCWRTNSATFLAGVTATTA